MATIAMRSWGLWATWRCKKPDLAWLCADRLRVRTLSLVATRSVAIASVVSREWKGRQPGLATDGPEFAGRHQLVRGIEGSEVHFDFIGAAPENRRSAAGAEDPPRVVPGFTLDRHRVLREDSGRVEQRAMVLAAIEAMANARAVRASRRHGPHVAAQATAGESVQCLLSIGQTTFERRHDGGDFR